MATKASTALQRRLCPTTAYSFSLGGGRGPVIARFTTATAVRSTPGHTAAATTVANSNYEIFDVLSAVALTARQTTTYSPRC